MRRVAGRLSVVLVLAAVGSGCGLNMEKHYQKMRQKLVAGEYDGADKYIDSVKEEFYKKDNRLLYYMDKGMVLHLAKRYDESNQFLERAKATADELWTESIGANAAAWLTTDNSLPYQGEDFEKVLIHFVAALNYAGLGKYEAARVEARQVTNKLELYNSKYSDEDGKSVYRDDAFARWLSGKLAETEPGYAARNDAWIDYKKALAVYREDYGRYGTPVPRFVVEDALGVLTRLGPDFAGELAVVRAQYPSIPPPESGVEELGEVVLLHLAGEAPYKVDRFWTAPAGDAILRIAYPEFVPKPYEIIGARVRAAEREGRSELAENISAIAIQNLNDHMGRIKAKAIARAVAKVVAAQAAKAAGHSMTDSGNANVQAAGFALQLAGAAFNIGSAIAEEADKRSWITLPAAINVARLRLPPGEVTVELELVDASGRVRDRARLPAKVAAGRPTILTYRTYR